MHLFDQVFHIGCCLFSSSAPWQQLSASAQITRKSTCSPSRKIQLWAPASCSVRLCVCGKNRLRVSERWHKGKKTKTLQRGVVLISQPHREDIYRRTDGKSRQCWRSTSSPKARSCASYVGSHLGWQRCVYLIVDGNSCGDIQAGKAFSRPKATRFGGARPYRLSI